MRSPKIVAVGAAALLLAAALASSARSSGAASHARNGRIVVTRTDGAIWSVKPSGKGLLRLTPPGSAAASPAFAPNGKRIVYARYPCDASGSNCVRADLWAMNADGSHQQQLTSTSDSEDEPAWSPDGRQIAYAASSGGVGGGTPYGIWVMNADGSLPHQLTQTGNSPAWSPDEKRIAYVAHNHVLVLSLASGRTRNLTPGNVYARDPAWSPDGRRIVFSLNDDLTVMNANGRHRHPLTRTASWNEMQPAWSPDGRWIAFIRGGADKTGAPLFQLDLIRPSGKGRTPVIKGHAEQDSGPAWQPR